MDVGEEELVVEAVTFGLGEGAEGVGEIGKVEAEGVEDLLARSVDMEVIVVGLDHRPELWNGNLGLGPWVATGRWLGRLRRRGWWVCWTARRSDSFKAGFDDNLGTGRFFLCSLILLVSCPPERMLLRTRVELDLGWLSIGPAGVKILRG